MHRNYFIQSFFGGVLISIMFFVMGMFPFGVFAQDPFTNNTKIPDFKFQVPFSGYKNVPIVTVEGDTIVASGLATYVGQLYAWLITAISIIAVVVLMVGGMLWMTSRGDSAQIQKAKQIISNALIGLLLTVGSYSVLFFINPALVQLPNLQIGGVKGMDISIAQIQANKTSGGGELGVGKADISKNITTYDKELQVASTEFGIDCTLLKAFMYAESSGNPNATSSVGAQGLVQLMPATAAGVKAKHNISGSNFDPQTNLRMGAAYLSDLKKGGCNGQSKNSVGCDTSQMQYLAASYNGGPGANTPSTSCSGTTWWQCEVNKGYAETRNYTPKVQGNYEKLKAQQWGC